MALSIGGFSPMYQNSYLPGGSYFAGSSKLNGESSISGSINGQTEPSSVIKNPGESDVKQAGKKSSPAECETCKERKYQDGSNEMVSFKSAAHLSPTAAGTAVRAHEQEHVSNAYKKAATSHGEVMQASVQIKTAVCPECGRTYVSGGETTTQIKYNNEENPYQKQRKQEDAAKYTGMNLDLAG